MASLEDLREAVRAQNLKELRKSEFQAIAEGLSAEDRLLALAPGEHRGREGYLVATDRRVFFVHTSAAVKAIVTVASRPQPPRLVDEGGGMVSLVFAAPDEEIRLDAVPRAHARTVIERLHQHAGKAAAGNGG